MHTDLKAGPPDSEAHTANHTMSHSLEISGRWPADALRRVCSSQAHLRANSAQAVELSNENISQS